MFIVVSQVNAHHSLPNRLHSLRALFEKADGYAFEDNESIERFVGGLRNWLKSNKLQSKYTVDYRDTDHHGIIEISRPVGKIVSSKIHTVMLRMKYFKPYGHVCVSKDGQSLYQQDFIKDNY